MLPFQTRSTLCQFEDRRCGPEHCHNRRRKRTCHPGASQFQLPNKEFGRRPHVLQFPRRHLYRDSHCQDKTWTRQKQRSENLQKKKNNCSTGSQGVHSRLATYHLAPHLPLSHADPREPPPASGVTAFVLRSSTQNTVLMNTRALSSGLMASCLGPPHRFHSGSPD